MLALLPEKERKFDESEEVSVGYIKKEIMIRQTHNFTGQEPISTAGRLTLKNTQALGKKEFKVATAEVRRKLREEQKAQLKNKNSFDTPQIQGYMKEIWNPPSESKDSAPLQLPKKGILKRTLSEVKHEQEKQKVKDREKVETWKKILGERTTGDEVISDRKTRLQRMIGLIWVTSTQRQKLEPEFQKNVLNFLSGRDAESMKIYADRAANNGTTVREEMLESFERSIWHGEVDLEELDTTMKKDKMLS